MKSLIIALLLVPSICCSEEWTNTDTALQAAYLALHVIDWGQTRDIANGKYDIKLRSNSVSMYEYKEANPILGSRPHTDAVNLYFIGTGIAHTAISYGLKKSDWKLFSVPVYYLWQSLTIGVEIGAVSHNFSAGCKVDF